MRFISDKKVLLLEPLVENPDEIELYRISDFDEISTLPLHPTFPFLKQFQSLLSGRQLLLEELPFSFEDIHAHYVKGHIRYRKGIENTRKHPYCVRCGNNDSTLFATLPCARCKQSCVYCRKCINMGRVSECTPLVSWNGPAIQFAIPEKPLAWNGTLSDGQRNASEELVKAVHTNQELLIWAVCGAGKTEILFAGIEAAINAGKKVCITTPRTDVVIELAPRIKAAFPESEVIALYGGSEDRGKSAPITIATTHQMLRFYKAFDLVIIDEVDAFPYSVEPMLQHAVQHAKKEISSTIYLTATPNQKWQKEIASGKRKAVTIPARYHRFALPVPTFVWCGNWEKRIKKKKLPANLLEWVRSHLATKKQGFLFVPRIKYLNSIVSILRMLDSRIEGVHSEDKERKEKVAAFRNGDIPILVTTTILERGVTVPNIDVAVLGAEDSIFTESALVQISGRVGRSATYPTGEILFFHYGKTREMVKAKRHIEGMNKDAKNKGLVD
ncbi:DEAD/DEAH box helicase [Fredinandcohnia sp. 179-A 10B2 NHS]|uniref:DEAD/DEAH box helicase n=1 Tax=Fredinandcohnia sp. 179-A 10B2 NHS TaxID=3235176 RepID=UPI0039A146B9